MVLKKITKARYEELNDLVKGLSTWQKLYESLNGFVTSNPEIMADPTFSDKTAEVVEQRMKYQRYLEIIAQAIARTPYKLGNRVVYSIINDLSYEKMRWNEQHNVPDKKTFLKAQAIFFHILNELYSQ